MTTMRLISKLDAVDIHMLIPAESNGFGNIHSSSINWPGWKMLVF